MDKQYKDTANETGIIFDLDGTLADTLEDLADSTNSVLEKHGFPGHPASAYKDMVGWGIRNLILRAVPEDRREEQIIDLLAREMLELYTAHPVIKTRAYPGIIVMLDMLKKNRVPCSILTNKADSVARKVVKEVLPYRMFTVVQGAADGTAKKPDPGSALRIASVMGVPPEKVYFIGDSSVDMQTASAAGMIPVGVSWGFRGTEELRREGARFIVHSPGEIPALPDTGKGD